MGDESSLQFERFTNTGTSYRPKASIRSAGQIGFSVGAIRRFGLEKYNYAVLFFDSKNQVIGIKPTNEPEEGANKLKVRNSGADVTAKAFLQYYEIPHEETRQYDAYWSDQHKMVLVYLEPRYKRRENQDDGGIG